MTQPFAISDDAFRELYDLTGPALRRYLAGLGDDLEVANELAQEAFLRLLTGAPPGLDSRQLISYLYTIATRLSHDRWRHKDVELRWRESQPDREATARIAEERTDLARAMSRLTLRQRTLLWLAYVEGFSHREIAEVMGMKERSVRVLLHRSRRKLEDVLVGMGISRQTQ